MKAIQVRYLAETDTKPTRIKAWAFGWKPITWAIHGDYGIIEQECDLVRSLCLEYDLDPELERGMLPNGDSVFVITRYKEVQDV